MSSPLTEKPVSAKFFERFIFCYWILYIFPYGFEYIYALNTNDLSFWTPIVPWFGKTFLGWTFNLENLAKGFDSKYDFARFILCALISILAAIVWVFIDSKYKLKYQKLGTLTMTILRYHVGFTMILYGLSKVFLLQFGQMGVDSLELTFGEVSPMSLLWTFMSYSKFYSIITGLIEVVGGVLLLFRVSTFLGAIISFAAMVNVVLIDIGYDVTVKMFAIHLLLMTIVLLKDDIRRMFDFFVLNKATEPNHYTPLFANKKIAYAIKYPMIFLFVFTTVKMLGERIDFLYKKTNISIRKLYTVEDFVVNGDTIPPLQTDVNRWKSFSIGGYSYAPEMLTIKNMSNAKTQYNYKADTVKKTLVFYPAADSTDKYYMTYSRINQSVVFKGLHKKDSIVVKTKPTAPNEYRLTRRGVRWVRDL
ncbi:hypothetical protein WSM22_20540 [Cytophagales bacterium WSM2-2]|nr:hypothetical protein WSM22_20540 [Cytophagales bacterium WSM2-2]